MHSPRIYADFQNADEKGRLWLNCAGTIQDVARHGVRLHEGLAPTLYCGDEDDAGRPDELRVGGVVEFSRDKQIWVAAIDFSAVRHASDERGEVAEQAQGMSPRVG